MTRKATLMWLGCVLMTAGCGARSGLGEWTSSAGTNGISESSAGSAALGGTCNGAANHCGNGNGGASSGGVGSATAGASTGGGGTSNPSLPLVAKAVSVGTDLACALINDGSVRCWGGNDRGQLGDGTMIGTGSGPPVRVLGIDNATAIATGGTWTSGGKGAASSSYGCAILSDRSIKCWGRFPGRPYDYSATDSPLPATIAGVSDAIAIAAGNWHACALLGNGSVQCWGDASEGELGNGIVTQCKPWSCPPDTIGSKPVTADLSGVTAISGQGSVGSCAVLAAGVVECWGSFMADVSSNPFPFLVGGVVTTANQLSAGYAHACAVTPSAGVQCWHRSSPPVAVRGFASAAITVTAGLDYSCALLDNGAVGCWHEAIGAATDPPTLRPVPDVSNAIAISAGYTQTCALISGGSVRCWVGVGGGKTETVSGF